MFLCGQNRGARTSQQSNRFRDVPPSASKSFLLLAHFRSELSQIVVAINALMNRAFLRLFFCFRTRGFSHWHQRSAATTKINFGEPAFCVRWVGEL